MIPCYETQWEFESIKVMLHEVRSQNIFVNFDLDTLKILICALLYAMSIFQVLLSKIAVREVRTFEFLPTGARPACRSSD